MRSDRIGYAYIKDAKTISEEASAEDLFTESDAGDALEMMRYVFDFVNELLKKHDFINLSDFP